MLHAQSQDGLTPARVHRARGDTILCVCGGEVGNDHTSRKSGSCARMPGARRGRVLTHRASANSPHCASLLPSANVASFPAWGSEQTGLPRSAHLLSFPLSTIRHCPYGQGPVCGQAPGDPPVHENLSCSIAKKGSNGYGMTQPQTAKPAAEMPA